MTPDRFEMKQWEFNLLAVESILAGAALMLLASVGAPRVISGIPRSVWSGVGFLLLGLATIPFQSAYARSRGREFSMSTSLEAAAIGALLYAAITLFWR
jgi:hypothetical protein